MLKPKMEAAFNKQLNAEYYSSYMYLSMAAYFDSLDLPGFSNWMRVQVDEERFHAMKFFDFISNRGGRVKLTEIAGPPVDWKSALDVFEATLAHEQKVTGLINDLVYLARDERDNASEVFLGWFVTEQVEEEDNVRKILGQLKLISDSPQALYMLDKELAARTFSPPVAE